MRHRMRSIALAIIAVLAIATSSSADCSPIQNVTGSIATAGAQDNWFVLNDHRLLTAYDTASRPHFVANMDLVASHLYVTIANAPGSGDAWRISVVIDNVETAVTCDIVDTDTQCDSADLTVDIARGEEVSIKIDSSTGATDPTNPGLTIFTFCLGAS